MKPECTEVEGIISSSRLDEVDPARLNEIQLHLNGCALCRNRFETAMKTDAVIDKLARSLPSFPDEEKVARAIINRIKDVPVPKTGGILDDLIKFVSGGAVRFALGAILIFAAASFFYMEYSDTGKIISLEEKMSGKWGGNLNYSTVFKQEADFLNFIYKFYELADGRTSYMELNSELILMKKSHLRALFEDYEKFDEPAKFRLERMRSNLLQHLSKEASAGFKKNELNYLRGEVERLKKELEESKYKRGIK